MKRYRVRLPPDVERFVRHLHPLIKRKIHFALEEIGRNPRLGKPLRDELKGLYSFRVSEYRIVYQIKQREVLVEIIDIAERKIVYLRLADLFRKTEG